MAQLAFNDVTHHYGAGNNRLTSVRGINLTVAPGEFVALIGPSGSGKSTLVKLAAGLEQPTKGAVAIGGTVMERRLGQTAYMPQTDALLPWRTVLDNVLLGAEVQGRRSTQARERALDMLGTFGLGGFEHVYPAQLSGGMRQRAAFLRTVMMERQLLLLDEPLSALDAFTRAEVQDWLLDVWAHFDYAIVLVTHDVREAVYLADRVVTLSPRPGEIINDTAIDLPRPRDRTSYAFHQQAAALTAMITAHAKERK